MTESQRKFFYFPKWLAVARKLDWSMMDGRLIADLDAQWEFAAMFSTISRDLVRQIIGRARELAGREARATTADDLRHALNHVASKGRHESATRLSNADLNEFDRICRLLCNPFEDLNSAIPYLNPEDDDRKRAIAYLRKLSHEAQLRAISENAFKTRDWGALNLALLNRLILIVQKSGRTKQPANQPF